MTRRLKEAQVERIRGNADIDLGTLYAGMILLIAGTIWVAIQIESSARDGETFVVVVLSLLVLVAWWIAFALWRFQQRRRRVSTKTRARRLAGILTIRGGRHPVIRVGDVDVWFRDRGQAYGINGAWVVVEVLDDGEVIDIVSHDFDTAAGARRSERIRDEKRRRKRERKRRRRR